MQDPKVPYAAVMETREQEPAWLWLPFDRIGLLLGPVVAGAWLLFGDPGSLSPEAHRLAGVMLLTIIWWVTEPIPIPVTGLLAVALCVFLGAVPADADGRFQPARTALAPFADPSVFFLLGGLFIGRAMTRHGLDRRIALSILCTGWAGRSPGTVLLAVGLGVLLVSMWISNTAATAMMYPVTLGIIAVLAAGRGTPDGRFARSPYASALLLITGYASSVGGVSTPIGTATNMVAMGYLRQPAYLGQSVDFVRWSLVGAPMALLIFVGLYGWLRFQAPSAGLDLPALREYFHREAAQLGRWKAGEVNTLIAFLTVVTLWVIPGLLSVVACEVTQKAYASRFPEEVVALLAPVLLFLLPVNWRARQFSLETSDFLKVDWGTVLLFGSGLCLGSLMLKTGLAGVVGHAAFDLLGTRDVWVFTALAVGGGIVLSEFTGNAATAATLIPVVLGICSQAEMDPIPPLLGVTFGASFGSALPVSTPPNAIIYGSGLLPVRRMIRAGIGLDLIAGVVVWSVLRLAYELGWTPVVR
jgi:sodium-dependent dicarboxylate transporter 2/3/5